MREYEVTQIQNYDNPMFTGQHTPAERYGSIQNPWKSWIDEEWNNNYSGDIVKINDLFISYEVIWFFEARFDSLRQAT